MTLSVHEASLYGQDGRCAVTAADRASCLLVQLEMHMLARPRCSPFADQVVDRGPTLLVECEPDFVDAGLMHTESVLIKMPRRPREVPQRS